jgi:hypothetical protein
MKNNIVWMMLVAILFSGVAQAQELNSIVNIEKGQQDYKSWEDLQHYSNEVTSGFKSKNAPN